MENEKVHVGILGERAPASTGNGNAPAAALVENCPLKSIDHGHVTVNIVHITLCAVSNVLSVPRRSDQSSQVDDGPLRTA